MPEVIDSILNKHIKSYFDTGDVAEKFCWNLLSKNALMAPNTSFIQRRAGDHLHGTHIHEDGKEAEREDTVLRRKTSYIKVFITPNRTD